MKTQSTPPLAAVVQPRLVRPVSFRGYDFDADRVVAVDPVTTHSTGNLSCDWKYGVRLRLEGAEIIILSPKDPHYGWAGNKTTREDLVRDAEALRGELMMIIWPNGVDNQPQD
jgi:hypothetical protein